MVPCVGPVSRGEKYGDTVCVVVALIERAAPFERDRGFGWHPGVIRLFDGMDVLELAHETVTERAFSLYGDRITD